MQQKELETRLLRLDHEYHLGIARTSDEEYDRLREEYESRYGPWTRVGAEVRDEAKKAILPYWMGSMTKKNSPDLIQSWLSESDHHGLILVEAKLDGVSALSVPPHLYTRGNGHTGTDISSLRPFLGSSFPSSSQLHVRGEIVIRRDLFTNQFKNTFKNSRNLVSGMVNAKTLPEPGILTFVAYEVLSPSHLSPSEQRRLLKKEGYLTPPHEFLPHLDPSQLDRLLDKYRSESEYDIDGLILALDTRYPRITSGNPLHSFAYKNISHRALVEVEDVLWRISQHGLFKPRIRIRPVELGGVTVSFTTGFNARYIVDHKIGKGAILDITRSGEVIPHILSVHRPAPAGPDMPDPPYEWNETKIDLRIPSSMSSSALLAQALHFFSSLKIRGMARKTLEKIMLKTTTIASILKIQKDELRAVGLGEKESENLLTSIQSFLTAPIDPSKLMAALPFFGAGMGVRKIQAVLHTFPLSSLFSVTETDLLTVPGWSSKSARSFLTGLPQFHDFLSQFPQIQWISRHTTTTKLQNKKFVFSGFRDQELEDKILKNGGWVHSTLTKDCSHLVIPDLDIETTKTKKARELGMILLTRNELQHWFQ